MHENFLNYIMIGLNRGFTLPTVTARPHGRRWDGGEYFSPEQWQASASQVLQENPVAENLVEENPVKVRSCSPDRQFLRFRQSWRLSWPTLCR
jgi:hypothetical protein